MPRLMDCFLMAGEQSRFGITSKATFSDIMIAIAKIITTVVILPPKDRKSTPLVPSLKESLGAG